MELEKVEGVVYRLRTNAQDRADMEAMEEVIQLIQKQKAAKPIVNRRGELVCPTCGQPLHPVKWCDCGQLIDWSEDKVELPTEIVKIEGLT